MTPANREQMLRILRENIMRGHFPAALPEHPPSLHYSDERNAWSTGTDIDTLVKKFRKELDTLAGFTYVVDSLDEAIKLYVTKLMRGSLDESTPSASSRSMDSSSRPSIPARISRLCSPR